MKLPGRENPSDDMALLLRVQRENQVQIVGKLLHDLRNPVHSVRITIELFGRLARKSGNVDALMERAARYIGPAESALESLVKSSERLGEYLGAPGAPAIAPLNLQPWLEELALLLRSSRRELQVTCDVASVEPALQIDADRTRLSHAFLRWAFAAESSQVALAARIGPENVVCIELGCESRGSEGSGADPHAPPFTAHELQLLIGNAGGSAAVAADGKISARFAQSGAAGRTSSAYLS